MLTKNGISKLARRRHGASLVEYGALVGLIAVGAIVSVSSLGQTVDRSFTDISATLQNAVGGAPAAGPGPVAPGAPAAVPDAPSTACVDMTPSLLNDLSTGATTAAAEGIGDCINVSWQPGFMDLADPQVGLTADPLFVNIQPSAEPPEMGATIFTPPATTIITASSPEAGVWFNVNAGGPIHVNVDGFTSGDLLVNPGPSGFGVDFPNGAYLGVSGDVSSLRVGTEERVLYEQAPSYDFSGVYDGGTFSVMGYNAITQGPTPPAETIVDIVGDGGYFEMVDAFTNKHGDITATLAPFSDPSGMHMDVQDFGFGQVNIGYWEEPDSCTTPPSNATFDYVFSGGGETFTIRSTFIYEPVPC